MAGTAGQNHDRLDEALAYPSSLDDHTRDEVERVWGRHPGGHWMFVEHVARWKHQSLSPAQRQAVVRLGDRVTALSDLLVSLLALAGQLRSGTIDRIMENPTSNSAWA